jgi:hypothetical protein
MTRLPQLSMSSRVIAIYFNQLKGANALFFTRANVYGPAELRSALSNTVQSLEKASTDATKATIAPTA